MNQTTEIKLNVLGYINLDAKKPKLHKTHASFEKSRQLTEANKQARLEAEQAERKAAYDIKLKEWEQRVEKQRESALNNRLTKFKETYAKSN